MEINFKNEIKKTLMEGNLVNVTYFTHHSEFDVKCEIFNSIEKNNLITNKFKDWWYELRELLSQNQAIGEYVNVNFYLEDENIWFDVTVTKSNWEYDLQKIEIYNENVIKILNIVANKNSIYDLEIDNIEFEIEFGSEKFKKFKIYYCDKELIVSKVLKSEIEKEIKNIFDDWSISIAINYISLEKIIELEKYDNFKINESYNYKFLL